MTTIIGNGEHATPAVVVTNVLTDPRATNTGRWQGSFGTGGAGTETAVTGATDGPVLPDGSQVATYMRYTWTTANTAGNIGGTYSFIGPATGSYAIGSPAAIGIYVRSSVALPASTFTFFSQQVGGADAANVNLATHGSVIAAGTWVRVGGVGAFTVVSEAINSVGMMGAAIMGIGATLDVTCALAAPGEATLVDHVDGAMADTVQFDYAWAGGVNDSASTRTAQRTIEPLAVLTAGYERAAGTLLHEPLDPTEGPVSPDVTLRPATSRAGSLDLFFASEADALEADALHTGPRVMALVDDVNAAKSMTYVVAGGNLTVRREVPYSRWVVTVPFREVLS